MGPMYGPIHPQFRSLERGRGCLLYCFRSRCRRQASGVLMQAWRRSHMIRRLSGRLRPCEPHACLPAIYNGPHAAATPSFHPKPPTSSPPNTSTPAWNTPKTTLIPIDLPVPENKMYHHRRLPAPTPQKNSRVSVDCAS